MNSKMKSKKDKNHNKTEPNKEENFASSDKNQIRSYWAKALIQFLHEHLGYKLLYLGLPGAEAKDRFFPIYVNQERLNKMRTLYRLFTVRNTIR